MMSAPEDLEETQRLVKGEGRQIVARKADVRDRAQLAAAVADGIANLGTVTSLTIDLFLSNDTTTTKKKITWLSADQNLCPIELVDFDHLLAKDKLSEEDEAHWEDFLTKQSETKTEAVADLNVWDVKVDDVLQFDRKGYFRCDVAPTKEAKGVFFKVPTGKE